LCINMRHPSNYQCSIFRYCALELIIRKFRGNFFFDFFQNFRKIFVTLQCF
jgi:hypothetical protein